MENRQSMERHILLKAVNTPNEQYMIPLTKRLLSNQQPHARIDLHDVLANLLSSKSEQSEKKKNAQMRNVGCSQARP